MCNISGIFEMNLPNLDIIVLDPTSLGADEGGGSTGEFVCIVALVIVDSVVVVAVSPTVLPPNPAAFHDCPLKERRLSALRKQKGVPRGPMEDPRIAH